MRTAVIMIGSNTFRAFSAGNLQLLLPGPMAQALHFAPLALSGLILTRVLYRWVSSFVPYAHGTVPLAVAGGSLAQRHSPRLVR